MKNIILFIALLVVVFSVISCVKETEKRTVVYEITRSFSGFKVTYLDINGELVTQDIVTNSGTDVWQYAYTDKPRNIVYVSASYNDINSAILVRILIDGKVYKQASTKYDTTMFVTVSGVIPDL